MKPERDAFGHEILDYFNGRHPVEIVERDDGYIDTSGGAEAYFSNTPLSGKDVRDERVIDLYSQALVRWFVGREGELDADALQHIERYQTLVIDPVQQGGD